MSIHKPFVYEKPSHRPLRYATRIREELVDIFQSNFLKDPRLEDLSLITITDLTITDDLKHGHVLFSLMGQTARAQDVEDGLNQATNVIRKELMHRLDTKITPRLIFKYDHGSEHYSEIESLLKKIK